MKMFESIRFPNMSVGLITRQSIRRALGNEITAELVRDKH